MIVQGRNLVVRVGDTAIACSRSCELSIDADTIEVSSASSGQWKQFITSRKSWSISVSSLVSVVKASEDTDNLKQSLNAVGTEALLTFEAKDSEGIYVQFVGPAILTGTKNTGTIGNLGQGSFSFQGNGELYDNTASIINCKGILAYQVGGSKSGYYLMKSLNGVINLLVMNIVTGGKLTQYFITPQTGVQYVVGTTTYYWTGSVFAHRVDPES